MELGTGTETEGAGGIMALNVRGSDSLHWKAGIDPSGVRTGAAKIKSIMLGLNKDISGMALFAGVGVGATVAFGIASKAAYDFAKDFETAMMEVKTISQSVSEDYEGMSNQIVAMSRKVPDSAVELTEALYQIVSAGYDGAKAMDVLSTSSRLATASMTSTKNAADVLTFVMNAYGDAAGTAEEISDKLFTIVRLGKVRMDELAPTLSMVTGLAAQLGLEFNELAAIYAESVKTLKPDIATTGIRGILTAMLQISRGTGQAADAARELGVEFDQAALKARGFRSLLQDLIEATRGNEAALGAIFPNVRGLIGLLAVMTDEGRRFEGTLKEIENSAGAVAPAFEDMVSTTENQWKLFADNTKAILKPLGEWILRHVNETVSEANRLYGMMEPKKESATWDEMRRRIEDIFPDPSARQIPFMPMQELDKMVSELEGAGVDLENVWIRLWDIYKNGANTAIERQRLLNELINDAAKTTRAYTEKPAAQPGVGRPTSPGLAQYDIPRMYQPPGLGTNLDDIMSRYKAQYEAFEEYKNQEKELVEEMTRLQTQQIMRTWKEDEKYSRWKIRNSRDLLEAEIARLESTIEVVGERYAFEMGYIQDLEGHKKRLEYMDQKKRLNVEKELYRDMRRLSDDELDNWIDNMKTRVEYIEDNADLRIALLEKIAEAEQEITDRQIENARNISDILQNMSGLIDDFDRGLAQTASHLSSVVSTFGDLMNAQTATGQLAGGIGVASTYISLMQSIFKSDGASPQSRFVEQMEKLNNQTSRQIDLLRKLNGQEALAETLNLFDQLDARIESLISSFLDMPVRDFAGQLVGTMRNLLGPLSADRILAMDMPHQLPAKYRDEWNQLVKNIRDARDEMEQYREEYHRVLTGTTPESIADSIRRGFEQGLDSAEVFANTFEDLMRNALLSSFERQMVTKLFEPFYDEFAAMAQGGLDPTEIAELEKTLRRMVTGQIEREGKLPGSTYMQPTGEGAQDMFEAIREIAESAGIDLFPDSDTAAARGMSGAIRGITEDTAGLMAGQMNAMRQDIIGIGMNAADMAAGISNIENHTAAIRINSDNLQLLKRIDRNISVLTDNSGAGDMRAIGGNI